MSISMKTYSISQLGKAFGLSRSTLLYYHKIRLLSPSGRSVNGYRCYSENERARLKRIVSLREAGLPLEDIKLALSSKEKTIASIIERRLNETWEEQKILKSKQHLLTQMLKHAQSGSCPRAVDKKTWVEMMKAAGMNKKAMTKWHAEFELRAPKAHHEFLLSLGIPENEVMEIRKWCVGSGKEAK